LHQLAAEGPRRGGELIERAEGVDDVLGERRERVDGVLDERDELLAEFDDERRDLLFEVTDDARERARDGRRLLDFVGLRFSASTSSPNASTRPSATTGPGRRSTRP